MVRSQGGRDGTERVRSLRGKREERREKREEIINRVDDSTHGKREERREKRETSTIKMRGSKDAMNRSQLGGMARRRVGL